MNQIQARFGKPRVLLPVVHCWRIDQVREAVMVAMHAGADGVFLINQGGMHYTAVLSQAARLASAERVPFVGVNVLGLSRQEVLDLVAGHGDDIHAIWSDNAGIHPEDVGRSDNAGADWKDHRRARGWKGLHFGGVAFKYQRGVAPEQWGAAAKLGATWLDVVTTSGPGTGEPPQVEKVAAMRAAIGNHALAVASGITPENVSGFLPFVDAYVVATGIESAFGIFDQHRVKALADAIHGAVRP